MIDGNKDDVGVIALGAVSEETRGNEPVGPIDTQTFLALRVGGLDRDD